MIIAILALLGLVFGSFVNAFVWRLREQELLFEKKKKPTKKQLLKFSILQGRSMCPHCEHELAAKDLVPVLSWLSLKGKCRYCAKPISWQYPAVELATAALFVVSYLFWPTAITGFEWQHFVVWLGFLVMFMALAVYDLRWFLLPDRIVYPLISVAALETVILAIHGHQASLLLWPALGALVIAGTFWVLFQVSAGNWIGGGDVKLGVVLGLWASGARMALLVIFFASLIGTVFSLPMLVKSKSAMKLRVPFGPFLLAATIVVVLFGMHLINWYTQRLLGRY
ncbi:MAG TPA: prepilin peptidase [Candidatus Microsaccharimonas sp.]|nr:prepilin peptidase [Candidatus Microsaccharimonas sp.]